MLRKINVGLIGYKFIGRAHAYAYANVPIFFDIPILPIKKYLCGRDEANVKKTANRWGWESYTSSWKELIKKEDVDLIDICTPSTIHKEVAISAAEEGKDIICEKPLALSLKDAKEMTKAVEKAGIKHMISFNYRFVPAIAFAKRLIEQDYIGKIYHFRAIYSQDWLVDPNYPLVWRLRKKDAGAGPSWDLGAHVVDLARYLVGEINEVIGMNTIFTRKRPVALVENGLKAVPGKNFGKVDVDDASSFIGKFINDALGLFETTRYATGHKNQNKIEVLGSKGGFIFDMERMNELQFYSVEDEPFLQGYKTIQVGDKSHPYMENWWPPGHIIGFGDSFVNEIYELLVSIAKNKIPQPNFYDGLKCQQILEAVDQSIKEKSWRKID